MQYVVEFRPASNTDSLFVTCVVDHGDVIGLDHHLSYECQESDCPICGQNHNEALCLANFNPISYKN
ncbi:hypothetical protein DERF_009182 [Dermatophagoides farinae]|uniref:Uncharacterized protein n=1 Tax=Dermatophagoides farinae TaxID=6954 RepID=A0A922HWE0_DERFA|nr:hypothetical protein DERF_009182 [Dermatophagoides farinae]